MKCYFAPMEGITGYIHRNAHNRFFPGVDKYFTAFIAPNQFGKLSSKEKNDILPENNKGMVTVPQMMTNRAEDFVITAKQIKERGYREVNLNLGCPSKTVVSKYRGAGFLAKPDMLLQFLDAIYTEAEIEISIKTRIGIAEPDEFYKLLEIFNRYPVKELIIHPRTQQDFYMNVPNRKLFKEALQISRNPLCYNGDIFTVDDLEQLAADMPDLEGVMIGRGLLRNPSMLNLMSGRRIQVEQIKAFHDEVYEGYKEVMFGEKPVLFKMKELWSYMGESFLDAEKELKKIKKSERFPCYEEIVDRLFAEKELAF